MVGLIKLMLYQCCSAVAFVALQSFTHALTHALFSILAALYIFF
jgi:hypothetical protein